MVWGLPTALAVAWVAVVIVAIVGIVVPYYYDWDDMEEESTVSAPEEGGNGY